MDIKVPQVGESVFEAVIGKWHKAQGEYVHKDELLLELETDKINLEIQAEADGVLSIGAQAGETVKIGDVIGAIDESAKTPAKSGDGKQQEKAPAPKGQDSSVNPAAAKLAREKGIDLGTVEGSGKGGRITLEDVQKSSAPPAKTAAPSPPEAPSEPASKRQEPQTEDRITRQAMSPIRKKIAERLVAVRQQTAMLTTFNEADMSRVIELRQKHREHFQKKHGVPLGMMSFFVKACVEALKDFPAVNARIDGEDIVTQHFYDIGIAVGSERGLLVPVIRDADKLNFAQVEQTISDFVERVQKNRITLADLEGGTFTISNGGVYGSVLSTPILNPPQSAVLGMHAIKDRAVVIDGEIVIRPIMNLALSYDHRIIDGREAVQFLKLIKEYVEEPEELLFEL